MRKQANDPDKQRARSANSSYNNQRLIDLQINTLICYLRRCPILIQKQFAPYLAQLKKQLPNNLKLSTYADQLAPPQLHYQLIQKSGPLVHNFVKLLQLKYLSNYFNKIAQRVQGQLSRPIYRKRQQIFSQRQTFTQLDMIYPDYDSYYKMSKQQKSHLAQHHPKGKQKDFFVQPRFLVRIEQFAHFRDNDAHKGDVIFVQYEGHTLAGGKVYLVGNQRTLELWVKESNNYPLPVLVLPSEEDGEKKQKQEEKKEKQKPAEPTGPMRLQFSHKFLGHTQKITSISLSQDEYYAITSSADRTIRLWCLRLKICLATYRGHTKTIWDVAFSPSGYYFLSGSSDGLMMLWKTDEPSAQRAYNHQADIYKVSFAKDPAFVISAGEDATIRIWRTLEADLLREIKLGQPIINFNLGFSGAYMATIESDGRVSVLDMLRGNTINSFYFEGPNRNKQEEKDGRNNILKMHDVCLSEDERELSCVCSHYVLVYSMDKLEKKVTNNIFTLYKNTTEAEQLVVLQPKEVLYIGGDTNLTHCSYQSRNVLVVAGHFKH